MKKKPKSTFEREMEDPKFRKAYKKAKAESKVGGQSYYQCPAFMVTKVYQDRDLGGYNIEPRFTATIAQGYQVLYLFNRDEMVKLIQCLQDIIDINDKLTIIRDDGDITICSREHP